MFYKNLIRFPSTSQDFLPDVKEFNEVLSNHRLVPCGAESSHSIGAVPLHSENPELYAVEVNKSFVFKVRIEQKKIPAASLADALAARIKAVEASGQVVTKKHRSELRDSALVELLSRALVYAVYVYCALSVDAVYVYCALSVDGLWVDTSSTSRAESIASYLRKCLGSLPVQPLIHTTKLPPQSYFSNWIENPPEQYSVGDRFVLFDPIEGGAVIRCKNQSADSDEVRLHIESGKLVSEISLTWMDKISFTIDQNLTIKVIKFFGIDTSDDDYEDEAGKLMAEAIINIEELTGLTLSLKSLMQ